MATRVNREPEPYEKIENKLETAAEKYLKDNDSLLPKKIGQTAEVSSDNLVSGGYISDLTEYTEEGVICSAKVIVSQEGRGEGREDLSLKGGCDR